jgi:hypothetical protein
LTNATPAFSAFVDTDVTNAISYYYVVNAVNSAGASGNSAQVSAVPVNDLVGRWRFDENMGSAAADSSGNGNTGTLLNSPAWVSPGKLGGAALQFTAASQQSVSIDNSSSLNSPLSAITLSAWINATDWSGNLLILQKGNSDNQYRLLAEGGLMKFHLNGVDTLTAPLPPTGVWVHIAASWDGSTMVLYTNGVQQASQGAAGAIAATSDVLAVAKKNGSGVSGDYFNGRLDDVRVYNRALSGVEIATLMTNSPPTFVSNPFSKPDANAGQSYSGTISTNAGDIDADALTFAKVSGPSWLTIASNGALSGTPLSWQVGTSSFVVRVTDSGSLSNTATMNIVVLAAPPIVAAVSPQGADVLLTWNGGIAPYQIQMRTNLDNAFWENVGLPTGATSAVLSPTNAAAFYRILGQ